MDFQIGKLSTKNRNARYRDKVMNSLCDIDRCTPIHVLIQCEITNIRHRRHGDPKCTKALFRKMFYVAVVTRHILYLIITVISVFFA